MTRRGSIAYYLVAVVCGAFFAVISGAIAANRALSGGSYFLSLYFVSLLCGWFSLALFALLLRRAAALFSLKESWQWMLAGMILAPALVWSLDALWTNGLQNLSYAVPEPLAIILAGGGWAARTVVRDEVRLTLASGVAGIATALLLHRVDRAFAERP